MDKISFTPRRIMATPAVRLRPVVLELGGKSANLLFDDVGLDEFIRVEGVGVSRH